MVKNHSKTLLKIFTLFHSTIKFTAEKSKKSVNFLDVKVIFEDGKTKTDLFVKETDTHQFLDSSSCHPYHCKKGIPYSQTLRLNRICSATSFFDKRCNNLEGWLIDRGYGEKKIRKEVLRARKFKRNDLLNKEPRKDEGYKLTFNITYHPMLSHVKSILYKLHVLLTCNKEHQNVFTEVPIIGFKNTKSLKDHLVRATR